jgi:hypothetical protein
VFSGVGRWSAVTAGAVLILGARGRHHEHQQDGEQTPPRGVAPVHLHTVGSGCVNVKTARAP